MTGIEIAVGVVFAWAVRRARRVGERMEEETGRIVDAGLDRVHDLVSQALGEDDPVLAHVEEEAQAGAGELSERTRQRLSLALEDAADRDRAFAAALAQAVAVAQSADQQAGGHVLSGNTFAGPTAIQVGDHTTQTITFGA
ncbi:conserved hypothetical protein [Frankia canadensis]|uniref:Chromosome partitioning protein n=1 Tax=Frankia canadensis TaxID=1836972 RepID=A0A2I2KZ21_9ACTN|nr:conserved hypothetical protein [Frankia canadensis]SOU58201.1 conserved hypothetical protein [Frankia canadensis]